MKKMIKNNKGFTLAELLIVVAIIAVLVAVSIPIFTSQLEKARESTDVANMRAAKALFVSAYLSGDLSGIEEGATAPYHSFYYDADQGILKDSFVDVKPYGEGTEVKGYEEINDWYDTGAEYIDGVIQCVFDEGNLSFGWTIDGENLIGKGLITIKLTEE